MLQLDVRLVRPGFTLSVSSLTLPMQGVTALFGRSGSGKSTLLRVLAGLEPAATGRVKVGDVCWQDAGVFVPPQARGVGVVFQDGALFPHMTVRQNLQFALTRAPRQQSLEEVAARCRIDHKLDAPVPALSGGERQRVAIARALLSAPQLLLLDEPLSALDTVTKREILPFLEELKRELGLPMIYVTHAPAEVERLADRVALMEAGRLTEVLSLTAALSDPISPLFADEGVSSVLSASVTQVQAGDGLSQLLLTGDGAQMVWLPQVSAREGDPVRLRVLARDVGLALSAPADSSLLNVLPARVLGMTVQDDARVLVALALEDQALFAQVTQRSVRQMGLMPGMPVYALVKAVALV